MRSLMLNLPNGSNNILHDMIWASGASIVFLVKLDMAKVSECSLKKFRDHIDAGNNHIIRLAERELETDNKVFRIFCMQTTGGGHFPAKNVHPEVAVNVFRASVEPLLDLHQDGVAFDIVSARSCARGITAENVCRFAAPGSFFKF